MGVAPKGRSNRVEHQPLRGFTRTQNCGVDRLLCYNFLLVVVNSNFSGCTMPTVRVRDKRQITLPVRASRLLGIAENDLLDVEITSNAVVLRRVGAIDPTRVARLMQFAGAGAGMNTDPDETVRAIRADRDTWR